MMVIFPVLSREWNNFFVRESEPFEEGVEPSFPLLARDIRRERLSSAAVLGIISAFTGAGVDWFSDS